MVKFRAWNERKGCMVYGPRDNEVNAGWVLTMCQANDIEPMQFTGLLDKNGAEIYQDDIVKDAKGNNAIIEWIDADACFAVQTGNSEIFTISAHKQRHGKLEIIGNRHTTPELLEGK